MLDLESQLRSSRRILVVAAHPDDETVGAGALIARAPEGAYLLHVTDGAPRDRRWWGAPNLPSREAYARVRREELAAAMGVAGVGTERLRRLGVGDQEAWLDLAGVAHQVKAVIASLGPEVVLTHPYEGGHPDHDSTAFAVHAAIGMLAAEGRKTPRLVEFTSYHRAEDGDLRVGEFLPGNGCEGCVLTLTAREWALKERMLAVFATQRAALAPFGTGEERFRTAPAYDFTLPPHLGSLHYEAFDWGCTGEEWRVRAGEAVSRLGAEVEAPC